MNEFKSYHPVVSFIYFLCTIGFSMFFTNPICLAISLFCSVRYCLTSGGTATLKRNLLITLPILLFTAVLNPIISHEGSTIIGYLPTGSPLTLEAIIYGWAAGAIIASVIFWFSCYNAVMTSDKFIYLFGRLIPSLSLLLSMILRFVPRFARQLKEISNTQRCIGHDISRGSIKERAEHGMNILSIMITRALEGSVETADSMRARGYGLPGRTAFSVFRFSKRDTAALVYLLVLGIYVLLGGINSGISYSYFPMVSAPSVTAYSTSIYIAYFMLCLTPIFIEAYYNVRLKENY